MTKLWVVSDLHLESVPYPSAFNPRRPEFDVLVVAGDVWQSHLQAAMSFLLHLSQGKPIVYVLGNHEHWYGTVHETTATARAMAAEYGINLLEDSEEVVCGVRFVGGTLWTDHKLGPGQADGSWIGEEVQTLHGNAVGRMTVGDGRRIHAATVSAIERALRTASPEPVVVVTHHAPHPDCTLGFSGTWAAGHSASDLSRLIGTGKIHTWVHGHVHLPVDNRYRNGTRVVCNPAGNMFSNPRFVEDLVIEV